MATRGQGRKHFRPWFLILVLTLASMFSLILAGGQTGVATAGPLVQAQDTPPAFDPATDLVDVPAPTLPPSARAGALLYQENCAPCHGATGMSDGPTTADLPAPPPVFADPDTVWDKSPAELFYVTKFGRIENLMPPWGNRLTDGQIWQAVAYSWSLHTSESTLADASARYAESCAACHGPQGAGDGSQATNDTPDFTDPTYAMAHSQAEWMTGWQDAHPEVGATWSTDEQQGVLEFVRTFTYAPPWESGLRPGAGVIEGQVVQGTPGGPAPGDVVVLLEAYADFTPLATFTTTLEADGRFTFTELATDESLVYLASATSAGVRYTTPLLTLTPDVPTLATEIIVYEQTTDPGGIQLDRSHWIIDFEPGAALVGQIFNFGSTSERTYVGQLVDGVDVPVTVGMSVPPGAQDLSFENGVLGGRFQQVGNLVYDTTPLVPGTGTKQIVLRYALPYDDDAVALAQEFLYPVTQIDLLVAELPGAETAVTGLASADSQTFQGRAYQIWQGRDLSPTLIEVETTGLLRRGDPDPRAGAEASGQATAATASSAVVPLLEPWMTWISGALIVILMAGVFGWAWNQGRIRTVDHAQALVQQRDQLLRQIARLDDLYTVGEVDTAAWQERRGRLKAELLEIATRLSDATHVI